MKPWKTFLAVAVIFLAGLLTGGALVWKLTHQADSLPVDNAEASSFQPWQLKDRYVSYLAKELELSPDQKNTISKIVTESQYRTKILFELVGPEMREEMRQVRDAIRAVLSPSQQIEFDDIQKRPPGRHRKENKTPPDGEHSPEGRPKAGDDALTNENSPLKQKCQNGWFMDDFHGISAKGGSSCSG